MFFNFKQKKTQKKIDFQVWSQLTNPYIVCWILIHLLRLYSWINEVESYSVEIFPAGVYVLNERQCGVK